MLITGCPVHVYHSEKTALLRLVSDDAALSSAAVLPLVSNDSALSSAAVLPHLRRGAAAAPPLVLATGPHGRREPM